MKKKSNKIVPNRKLSDKDLLKGNNIAFKIPLQWRLIICCEEVLNRLCKVILLFNIRTG